MDKLTAAAGVPEIRTADCRFNAGQIAALMRRSQEAHVSVLALPELCLTGCTCGDLFSQHALLRHAADALDTLLEQTADLDVICALGLPRLVDDIPRSCAVLIRRGQVLALRAGARLDGGWRGCRETLSPPALIETDGLRLAMVFSPDEPCPEDAQIVLCLSSMPAIVGRADWCRLALTRAAARRCVIFSAPGQGESTTDCVYDGLRAVTAAGRLLAESRFDTGLTTAEVDLSALCGQPEPLPRPVCAPASPWLPEGDQYTEELLRLQCLGLERRMAHTGSKQFIVGVSGGLDSTLAMLVCAESAKHLGLSADSLLAVTMPCFGTTKRTRSNAELLARALGAQLRTVDVTASVLQHFSDIGHDPDCRNAAYENAQARERTQVLMDLSNESGGLVIGTGDLSELALGWATYNGDHMSMYGVNAGVPKTVIRRVVEWYAGHCAAPELAAVLRDILATPVSPELLPAENGEISQITEDLVGPYELHDFFLYAFLQGDTTPAEIFEDAQAVFQDVYPPEVILGWLRTFLRRFFSQQFKRSCMPDGPQVLDFSLSPRGGWAMPSDAAAAVWLSDLEGALE